DWHRNLLSQYLSHTAQRRQEGASSPQGKAGAKPANPDASAKDTPQAATSKTAAQGPTATGPAKADKPAPASGQGTASPSATPPTAPPRSPSGSPPEDLAATYVVDQPDELEATLPRHPRPTSPASPPASPTPAATGGGNAPLHLYIDERYESLDEATLATLQPKELMQALLSKVLQEGIGRLYFERQAQSGRILWSRDGVLQAVLGDVDALIFQGVINELKLLTHLSLISVRKPRQVEIERLYQGDRILLRFRVMPGNHGEEATLQVLRGTALRFYQQQQIDKLGRDALDAAQMLQGRLNEIRDRARQTLNSSPHRSETLPIIIQMLKQMESQVHEMILVYEAEMKSQNQRKKQ
ncbi:MAG: hypothetical protein VKJ09_09505, partial [Leptolyngbya sp.]|nr:hypothetical protein [Leptolyngbya sp.]